MRNDQRCHDYSEKLVSRQRFGQLTLIDSVNYVQPEHITKYGAERHISDHFPMEGNILEYIWIGNLTGRSAMRKIQKKKKTMVSLWQCRKLVNRTSKDFALDIHRCS